MTNGVGKGKALLEEQQRKTQELRDRLTTENVENKEKVESDIKKAKIRKKDIQQEFRQRLASAWKGMKKYIYRS